MSEPSDEDRERWDQLRAECRRLARELVHRILDLEAHGAGFPIVVGDRKFLVTVDQVDDDGNVVIPEN